MSSATKCKWMWWEYLWNHVLIVCVLCHVDGQWSRLAALFWRPPGLEPVWRFLLTMLRIIGLEASQWNSNISLTCIGSVYIDSRLHLWLSHFSKHTNVHPDSNYRHRKHCEEMSWEWIGMCWCEQHVYLCGCSVDKPVTSVFNNKSALSLSFASFLHFALLHNKYQITDRALDASFWYYEPKHHTTAFALPVVQWCHFLFMNNSLIHSQSSMVQLLHEISKISVGVNLNQIKFWMISIKATAVHFLQDHHGNTERNWKIDIYLVKKGIKNKHSSGYDLCGTNCRS